VQMFILHPQTLCDIQETKEIAEGYGSIFYSLPLHLSHLSNEADGNCVAFSISCEEDCTLLPACEKPIVVDESYLSESVVELLRACRGIILNATGEHENLSNFYLAMGIGNVGAFDSETLSKMSMDRIVLQSTYPTHGFDEMMDCVKVISNAMFRPEQSIIARATKSSLELFGFRKG